MNRSREFLRGPHRVPERDEVERLMKRCQIGCSGRNALHDAHDLLAECYGTLGLLMQCVEFYRARAGFTDPQ